MTRRSPRTPPELFTFRPLRRLLAGVRAGLTPEAAAHKAAIPARLLKASLSKAVEDLDIDPGSREARLLLALRHQEAACQTRWVGLLELSGSSRVHALARYAEVVERAALLVVKLERDERRLILSHLDRVARGFHSMDSKAFMYLLERRFPKDWGPVATATDMHTAAAIDLLRQGVTELKRAQSPQAITAGSSLPVSPAVSPAPGETEGESDAGTPLSTRAGVGSRARVPISFVDDARVDQDVRPLNLNNRTPGSLTTPWPARRQAAEVTDE